MSAAGVMPPDTKRIPAPCGCEAKVTLETYGRNDAGDAMEIMGTAVIFYCPLHEAAREMLEALKALSPFIAEDDGMECLAKPYQDGINKAKAAIAKAEGKS